MMTLVMFSLIFSIAVGSSVTHVGANTITASVITDKTNAFTKIVSTTKNAAQKKPYAGQYVSFGQYNKAPILWKILQVDQKGNLLLQSDKIITFKALNPIDDSQKPLNTIPNAWSTSCLRKWLNSTGDSVVYESLSPAKQYLFGGYNAYDSQSGFLKDFTTSEQSLLVPYTHKVLLSEANLNLKNGGKVLYNSKNRKPDLLANYDDFYYQNVTDKVFLPSVKLVDTVIRANKNSAAKIPTPEAIKESNYSHSYSEIKTNLYQIEQNLIPNPNSAWCYWTDTPYTAPGYWQTSAYIINSMGYIDSSSAYNGVCGVCPIIYLKSTVKVVKGDGSYKDPFVFEGSRTTAKNTEVKLEATSNNTVTAEINFPANTQKTSIVQIPYPAKYQGKWGYINQTGKFVIKPQYNDAGKFSEGLAYVKIGDLYGYINMSGKLVVKPNYGYAADFSEGVALVSYSTIGSDFMCINSSGKVLFTIYEYDNVWPYFGDGLLPVQKNGKYGFMDKNEKLVLPCKYDWVSGFKNGYCIAKNDGNTVNDNTYYLIDKKGKELIIIKEKDGILNEFSEGIVTGSVGFDDPVHLNVQGKAIIDKNTLSSQILPSVLDPEKYSNDLSFATFWSFENGVSPFLIITSAKESGASIDRWGIMDKQGRVIIQPYYNRIGYFQNGLALAAKCTEQVLNNTASSNGEICYKMHYNSIQYVYIDQQGNEVIKLSDNVVKAGQFIGGIAPFKANNNKYGFIDHNGKVICQPIFDDVKLDSIY